MARRETDRGERAAASLSAWSLDVRAALRRLEPTQRRVVQLVYFERRTQHQAATELGVAPRVVSRALATALQALALAMTASYSENGGRP